MQRAAGEDPPQNPETAEPAGNRAVATTVDRGVLTFGGAVLFLATLAATMATGGDPGMTWDEPAYLHSARGDLPRPADVAADATSESSRGDRSDKRHRHCGIRQWFARLLRCRSASELREIVSKRGILQAWDYNRYGPNFHPPLSGVLAVAMHEVTRPVLDDWVAWRAASAVEFALAATVLFLFLGRRDGPWVGAAAALSLVCMPRVFGDAHIFGTDMPMMAAWALAALAFWNGLESPRWRVLFGVALGVCFVTKFSAMLVVLPILVWLLAYRVVPRFSAAGAVTAGLATAWVAWPLAVAGIEVARLAEAIRVATQTRLSAAAAAAGAMSRHVAYVDVRDLAVQSALPAWILLVPLGLWLAWCLFAALPLAPRSIRETGGGLKLWLAGLAIAPAAALALNPTWWFDTLPQLGHYYQITAGRSGALPDIEIFYLGKKYIYSLPWHNGFVLAAVTVPVLILALAAAGLASALWWARREPLRMYFVLQALALPLLRMLPTPAHDGVRLMLPTFFFLAGLAGWGFGLIVRLAEQLRTEEYSVHLVPGIALVVLFAAPLHGLWRSHPYELSFYNGLIGGLPGAQRAGFEPTYWYDAVTPPVRAALNDAETGLPAGAVLHPPDPRSAVPVFDELQAMGLLRADIGLGEAPAGQFPYMHLLSHSSKAVPFTRLLYALRPWYASGSEGVRLFSVYDPASVSRAFVLTLLLDDNSSRGLRRQVNRDMIERARRSPHAVELAGTLLLELGVDGALARAREREPEAVPVIEHLARRPNDLQQVLSRRKQAVVEAVEILVRVAGRRPALLQRIVEYEGYLPAEDLGEYLDSFMTPQRAAP